MQIINVIHVLFCWFFIIFCITFEQEAYICFFFPYRMRKNQFSVNNTLLSQRDSFCVLHRQAYHMQATPQFNCQYTIPLPESLGVAVIKLINIRKIQFNFIVVCLCPIQISVAENSHSPRAHLSHATVCTNWKNSRVFCCMSG